MSYWTPESGIVSYPDREWKDFIALADHIKSANRYDFVDKFTDSQLDVLAAFCKEQNPRFMKDRWLDYIAGKCGKNGGKVKAA